MSALNMFLSPIIVKLDNILLDPNNPRFAELGESFTQVPENRFAELKIQKITFERMKEDRFDVSELKDTIKTLGFLPMDKVVVRLWRYNNQDDKYVVVEGNRRIAALKWLVELHDTGKETFTDEQITNFTELDVLLLDDTSAPESAKWVLPGLRHVSGIKEWGPYQKARAVYSLRESGLQPQDVAQSLGLSTRSANQLWRSYLALEQMKADEEYGEYADPKKYTYFDEIFRKANLRDWLKWDESGKKFTNMSHLKEFYSWIIGEINEDQELTEPKISDSREIRDLGKIIDDLSAMAVFRSVGGTLNRALAKYDSEHPDDWRPIIVNAEIVLSSLTPDQIRSLESEDLDIINKLKNRVGRLLSDYSILIKKA